MATPVLTVSATLLCAHGGPASPGTTQSRVHLSGAPAVCVGDPVFVNACQGQPPCISLRLTGSERVTVSGQPIALAAGAVSEQSGMPAIMVGTQTRVMCG